MKRSIWLSIAVSCFANFGNAQDSSLPSAGLATTAYNTQGSASYNQEVRDREQKVAAVEARQLKAIKQSMAVIHPASQKYLSAEDYLKANRPPMPPASQSLDPSPVRQASHVPEFDSSSGGKGRDSSSVRRPASPSKPRNLMEFLKRPKETELQSSASERQASQNPFTPEGIAALESETPLGEGDVDMIGGNTPPSEVDERKGLGRLFGRKNQNSGALPAENLDLLPPAPDVVDEEELVSDGGGALPEAPQWAEQRPAPQPTQEASIFVKRQPEAEGEIVTVLSNAQAEVEGVRVMLYEGSKVHLISKSGSRASIRLPDQRTGTVDLSALNL